MTLMENFRDFQIGPDPFGRVWHVLFKYIQNGISIRHSDSIDVCFILQGGEEKMTRTVVINHGEMRAWSERTGHKVSDTWCSRIAACKLRNSIETGEDIEKEYLPVTPQELDEYDSAIRKWEQEWLKAHAA